MIETRVDGRGQIRGILLSPALLVRSPKAIHLGVVGVPAQLDGCIRALRLQPAPTKDNLLVFYVPSRVAIARTADRLAAMAWPPVTAENPYWDEHDAVTIEDPDGWRVVLVPTQGI
jgi:hypothetical protein